MHEAELPLTPTQEGMLFNGLAEAGAEVQQLVVQPPRSFDDVEQMRLAWGAALARHPMLRASFRWRGVTAPCQRVHEAVELPWEVLHQELDREAALRLFLRLDRLTPLPLERAPAFRLTLLRARDGDALVWTHHHAQLDGRSLELVLLDVLGALAGAPPPAAPSPSVEPHLRAIEAGRGPRQDEFFASRFADLWEPTPLPGPRPAASAEAEADERHLEHEYMACGEWLDALERQGEAEGFTLATAIQAAWATVLARYAGTSDVTFCVTRACRHVTSESAAMVGCLINTVPLRVDVDASPSARALARSLRAESLALREHETVALRRVAELSPLTSAADLARSVVVVEGHGLEDRVRASFPELASWRLSLRGRSAAPLTLAAYRRPDGLQLVVEHDRRRVAASIASTLGRRVERALRAFATDLDRAPAEAPLTFSTEHAPLRGEDVAIDTSPPTFPARFVAAAERSPHKVALVDEATGREVSYAELLAQARACVERLRADGAKAGDVVAVWAGRRVETIEAMVACALGGLVYFPLDPAYPPDRTAFVLRDSGARWYLAPSYVPATDLPPLDDVTLVRLEPPAAPRPPELADAPRVVGLGDGPHTAARRDRGPADHADATTPAAGEAAYLIYTSGSTGTPKGVLVSHGNLAAHTSAALETYALSDSDRGMLFASPSFDVSLEEVVPLLSVGGSLVIRSDATASSPDRLLSTVASHGVTVLQLPTAFFHELARHMERRRASLPASVRLVVIGGERASASACRRFRSVAPDVRLVNAYGPTEVTITATSYDVPREVPSTIPIGRPFGRCHAYVLDARGAPVPTGARGELALGGPQVAIGYHDRPEPTAARFVADPVDPSRGRVYLTGDLVQLGAGGELEFLGRRDGQVKVRGFRIELAEVEAALEQDDDVAEAVATVLDAPSGEPTLVAFVVGRTPRLDLVAIDRRLRQRLPPQHVPARIASLDALPRAPGGKLDRRALQ
ncbi:MAG: amino acid adenylation domain-containing protein [Myxococcales bacterium]|nr:amino acid adenylation domain-containing protein [Myxococcales bacterium]